MTTKKNKTQNNDDAKTKENDKNVKSAVKNSFASVENLLSDIVSQIQNVEETKNPVTGVPTGFEDLDNLTAGFQPSDFIILASRPSMGKSAFALNIALNAALRSSKKVAIFSLEMSSKQVIRRMLFTEGDVSQQFQQQMLGLGTAGKFGDFWNRLWVSADRLTKGNLFIDDTPGLSLPEICSRARDFHKGKGVDLIIIDYLQLMPGIFMNTNRTQEMSEISRGLKTLARELDVPVLALSQLSRNVEARQIRRPMLSDLRDSGTLEEDADIVMFLYRDDYYKGAEETPTHITELNVAKNRNGPVGRVHLFFKNECTKFLSLARRKD